MSEPTGEGPGGQGEGRRSGRFVASGKACLAALGSAPWLKAPILLLRFPGLLLAMASAFLILAVATAAGPLFLSSAGNATLHRTLQESCPWDVGVEMRTPAALAGLDLFSGFVGEFPSENRRPALVAVHEDDAAVRKRFAGIPNVAPVEWSVVGSSLSLTEPHRHRRFAPVRLLTKDLGLAHIRRLTSSGGPGVWLPDTVARFLRVKAGGSIVLEGPAKRVRTTIAGTYRDLSTLPRTKFWCGQEALIYAYSAFANTPPPPLVLADRDTFLGLENRLGERSALISWNVPILQQGLTLSEANQAVTDVTSRKFVGDFGLPFIADLASATRDSMRGTVDMISLAGRLVALVVIGAAGTYWVHRRRPEVGLLTARGASPAGIGLKAAMETLPVAALAGAAGWLLSLWLVPWLGPTRLLDAATPSSGLRQVVWTVAGGLALLVVVVALAVRNDSEVTVSRARQALARAPWEIPVLLLAGAALYEILSRQPPHVTDVRVPVKPDVLILLFPILFITGMAGVATRILQRALPQLRSAGDRWSPALFLSSRRLASAPQAALTLLTIAALAVGILVYAGTLTVSQASSARVKAQVFVGSDIAVNLAISHPLSASLPFPTTRITRVTNATLRDLPPGSNGVDVLGIEPDTFSRVAYWDRTFAPKSLDNLLRTLRSAPAVPLPVISVGGSVPRKGGLLEVGTRPFRYTVVGTAHAFPGLHSDAPMAVVLRDALRLREIHGIDQLWAKGDPASILSTLRKTGSVIEGSEALAEETRELPQFLSLRWALGFLQAFGIMTGLIALGGILLHLESRQRAREVAYALARRMGLSRSDHQRSVALELAAMLALGVVLGVGLAWVAARLVYGKLDPMPLLPPAPLFRSPWILVGVTVAGAAIAALVGAWQVQRRAERTNVAEVMRVAG